MNRLEQKITKRLQEHNIPARNTAVLLSMEKMYNDGVLDGYQEGYKAAEDFNNKIIKEKKLSMPPLYHYLKGYAAGLADAEKIKASQLEEIIKKFES